MQENANKQVMEDNNPILAGVVKFVLMFLMIHVLKIYVLVWKRAIHKQ